MLGSIRLKGLYEFWNHFNKFCILPNKKNCIVANELEVLPWIQLYSKNIMLNLVHSLKI